MRRVYGVVLALLFIGQVFCHAAEPATPAEAKMQIEKIKQEITVEEKAWSEEVTHEKAAVAKRKQRFGEFNQDKQHLQQSIAEQDAKLKSLLGKMEGHQFKERELQARFKQLGQVVASQAQLLRSALVLGLPYQMDKRLAALDLLTRDLQGENISAEEALNRLWAIYQNERRLAQEAEVYSGDFSSEGSEPIQVKYLRIGKQLLAFSSMDGLQLGLLNNSELGKFVWVREKQMDHATRQALKQAIATAEGKSVPGFVSFPLYKTAFATTTIQDTVHLKKAVTK